MQRLMIKQTKAKLQFSICKPQQTQTFRRLQEQINTRLVGSVFHTLEVFIDSCTRAKVESRSQLHHIEAEISEL